MVNSGVIRVRTLKFSDRINPLLFPRQHYFKNCASPSTGNPPSASAFLIADTSVFSSSNHTVTQWFFVSVVKFETPSIPFRIEPTLAAVPAQTHPGTINFTVLSPANKDWGVVKTNNAARITTNTIGFFFKISALLLFYSPSPEYPAAWCRDERQGEPRPSSSERRRVNPTISFQRGNGYWAIPLWGAKLVPQKLQAWFHKQQDLGQRSIQPSFYAHILPTYIHNTPPPPPAKETRAFAEGALRSPHRPKKPCCKAHPLRGILLFFHKSPPVL